MSRSKSYLTLAERSTHENTPRTERRERIFRAWTIRGAILLVSTLATFLTACKAGNHPDSQTVVQPAQPKAIPQGVGQMVLSSDAQGDQYTVNDEQYIQVGQPVWITYTATQNSNVPVNSAWPSPVADLHCEVADPDGVKHAASKPATWAGASRVFSYTATVSFTYPFEFSDGQKSASTSQLGNYWVHCYWNVKSDGFDGPMAETQEQFRTGKEKPKPIAEKWTGN
jgi:hypothetical protein